MTPYFSVIVPVYKVEPWLRQCVDSILGQRFGDFELLLVDDGSPDNCPAICDEYAEKDKRVTVIHQQNAGLAKARKTGLLRAAADYVCFVDSDDWVEPDWLETVRDLAEQNGRPDIVLFDLRRDVGQAEAPMLADEGYYDKARLDREVYPYMLWDSRRRPFGTQLIPAYMVTRAWKRQLLLDHYIEDDAAITLFEDIAMAYECMYYAADLYICQQALYVYRIREQSLLMQERPQRVREVQTCFDYVRRRLGGLDPALDRQINAAYFNHLLLCIVSLVRQDAGSAGTVLRDMLRGEPILRKLSVRGLPWDMKMFLLVMKCRLYRLAAAIVRRKM